MSKSFKENTHWSKVLELQRRAFSMDELIPLIHEVGLSLFIASDNTPRWDLFSIACKMQGFQPYLGLFYLKNLTEDAINYLASTNQKDLNAFILKHEEYILFHNPHLVSCEYMQSFFTKDQLDAYSTNIERRTNAIAKCNKSFAEYAIAYWNEKEHASRWVRYHFDLWCSPSIKDENPSEANKLQLVLDCITTNQGPLFNEAIQQYKPSNPDHFFQCLMYLSDSDDINHENIRKLVFNTLEYFSVDDAVHKLKKLTDNIALDFSPNISDYCQSPKALEMYIAFMVSQNKMTYAYVMDHPDWDKISPSSQKSWHLKCLDDNKVKNQILPPGLITSWCKNKLQKLKYSSTYHHSSTLEDIYDVLSSIQHDKGNKELQDVYTIVSSMLLYQTSLVLNSLQNSTNSNMPKHLVDRHIAKQTKLLVELAPNKLEFWKDSIPITDLSKALELINTVFNQRSINVDKRALFNINETTQAIRGLDPQWLWYNTFLTIVESNLNDNSRFNLIGLTP